MIVRPSWIKKITKSQNKSEKNRKKVIETRKKRTKKSDRNRFFLFSRKFLIFQLSWSFNYFDSNFGAKYRKNSVKKVRRPYIQKKCQTRENHHLKYLRILSTLPFSRDVWFGNKNQRKWVYSSFKCDINISFCSSFDCKVLISCLNLFSKSYA